MHSFAITSIQLFLFSCLVFFHYPARAQNILRFTYCDTANNYTSGSVYEQNLNHTLSSLSSNASLTGFHITTEGQNPNTVYGLLQCRGDITKEACQTCAYTASEGIIQLCPNKKEAFIVYEYCSLRYSDWRYFSTVSSIPRFAEYNGNNVSDPDSFNRQLGSLVEGLSSNAASSSSKFAIGSINYTNFNKMYAMVQCTRDLAEGSCSRCLQDMISYITQCCNRRQGVQIFSLSCNLRFEVYSFFQLLPPPPPEAVSSPPASLPEPESVSPLGKKSTSKTAVVVVAVAVALVVTSIVCGCFFWRKGKKKRIDVSHENGEKSMESLLIGLDKLKVATRNFADENKLGAGGFGPVYKGKLFDGREIAVKRLSSSSGQGLEELKTEVILVAKLLHRNLVKLLGFCLEEEEKLLVYEYLPSGSLDKILFDDGKRISLKWERRYKIIVGIARGLLYLHEDSQLRIIHRDLKASNILLDEYMNPKISDFGLARLFGETQTHGKTNRISGTYGYMAPEYAKNGHFSTKSDVYSYGVLLLELVTGRKNSSFRKCNTINLSSYAWQHWTNGTGMELLDPMLGDQWPKYDVLKCIHIGLLCVQEAAADRPTMSEIVMMLSSYSITSPAPSRPAFFVSNVEMEDRGTSHSDKSNTESLQQSVNDVTISELVPR